MSELASDNRNTRRQMAIGYARGLIFMATKQHRQEAILLSDLCNAASAGLTEMGAFETFELFKDSSIKLPADLAERVAGGDFSRIIDHTNNKINVSGDLHFEDITVFDLLFPQAFREVAEEKNNPPDKRS